MFQKLKSVVVAAALLPTFASTVQAGDVVMLLGLGDSIGEAVQSADASFRTQPFSYLNLLTKQMGVPFNLPLIKSGPLGVVDNTDRRSRLFSSVAASNLAVSGADVHGLLNDRADALTEDEIDSETDLVLFPRLGSQIGIAESVGASFVICWIGSNDVLSAVTSFDELDASQMTPVDEFSADFREVVQRLTALGIPIVMANTPDVTKIGFLFNRHDLVEFLGSDYGLADGSFTSLVVMLLIRLGLDDGSLIKDPNFVLDASEVELIQQRVETFNQIIEDATTPLGIPVLDSKALFDAIAADPPVFHGVPLTPRFLGGLFSLDGIHPSNIGHALLTNEFIKMINTHFQTDIPPLSETALNVIALTDPFVDKDGDGRVRGRFGAGLLETLGPLLGISGDQDDFTADPFWVGVDESLGNRFIERLVTLQGKGPQVASKWRKRDAIEAFKRILAFAYDGNSSTSNTEFCCGRE
jgi:lysophospholipase L1-like esterase